MYMPTAKKYMNYEHGEPFRENGKMYVNILTGENSYTGTLYTKKVRWYSDAEWERMYSGKPVKKSVNFREILGFGEAGYITVYYGETYPNLDWFKEHNECRYHKIFGWYTPSDETVSEEIPEGVKTAKLYWDGIKNEYGEVDEDRASAVIAEIRYEEVESGDYVGEVGERKVFTLRIKKAITLTGFYGVSTMHIMEDENGNTFVWTTAAKTLEVGATYMLKGTVKDHKEYKGVKQTILTRCAIVKDKE